MVDKCIIVGLLLKLPISFNYSYNPFRRPFQRQANFNLILFFFIYSCTGWQKLTDESTARSKNIYIYIILFIFIYLYINTVLVEREFVRCSRRTISFFSTASRDLCLIGFAFKAAVFERAVSQTSVYDTTRTLISLHHFVSLFTFYLQRRNENPRVPFLFRQVRLIWQWFSLLLLG